jgi:hypothetical protein
VLPRVLLWVGIAFVVVCVALLAQIAFAAFWVSQDAKTLDAQVDSARAALAEGRFADAAADVDAIATTSRNLRDQTEASTWWRAQQLPIVGRSFEAVHVLSRGTADVADAAQPVFARLQSVTGAGAGIVALSGSAEDLKQLRQAVSAVQQQVDSLPPDGLMFGVDSAVRDAQETLPDVVGGIGRAADIADLLPAIVGTDQPGRWLVMLQNPAESRGSGGLFSAFAVIEVADGKPQIVEAATRRSALDSTKIPYISAAGADSVALWGDALADWASFNLSADFPTVAKLASAGMAARGTPVQGVIAIDPSAVAAMLACTGSVEHKGVTIDANSAEAFFTKDIYSKFPDFPDVAAKDELSMGLLFATADSLLTRPLALRDLWSKMQAAISDGHLKAWSSDAQVQAWLQDQPVGGHIRAEPGPDVVLALNNGTGGKVDAYVTSTAEYDRGRCLVDGTDHVQSHLTWTFSNDAPANLPPYVDFRLDDPSTAKGSTKDYAVVYGPKGGTAAAITIDGSPVSFRQLTEAGRPVWGLPVELARGQKRTVTVTFREPAAPGVAPTITAPRTGGGTTATAKDSGATKACPPAP